MARSYREIATNVLVKGGHAEWTPGRLKTMMKLLHSMGPAGEKMDPGQVVEANMNQLAAELSRWCQKLDIGFDFEAALELDKHQNITFRSLSVPLADVVTEKGGPNNVCPAEYRDALQRAARSGRR